MIDLECMIKFLCLVWLKRIFSENEGIWKNYLCYFLFSLGGIFFFNCNFDIKDYIINFLFYFEFLMWWLEFCENFVLIKDWCNIIWNNKEICINNFLIFYKNFFDFGIVRISDLLFNLNSIELFNIIKNRVEKINFFIWVGFCYVVFCELKNNMMLLIFLLLFVFNNNVFDIIKNKLKYYYLLLINKKV